MNDILRYENIQKRIITLRGTEIILDSDLSGMYEVETRVLKQAVRRNINRFPAEFMFELTENEINSMVSQSVIPSKSYFGGATPYAFTEQGVAMGIICVKFADCNSGQYSDYESICICKICAECKL